MILFLLYKFRPPANKTKKDPLSDTIANAAIAITKAISPFVPQQGHNIHVSNQVGFSPGKSADLHTKTTLYPVL